MSQDKELEIRLQFLDEAQEYLDTIDAALLGLANIGIDSQKVNAALRAAHSVKGGAAMMGFQALSQFAHRLEDSFKVLKVQRNTIAIDADLERLLLAGADCLRKLVEDNRHRRELDWHWLENHAQSIFDQLHERLGDPQAEDANSVLSPEEGQDIVPLLFETEVEGCLQRLESVLQENQPCLREEVEILAQELGGLGEMLQLPAFTQLCGSIAQALTLAPDRTQEIARAALQTWRRTQALVLTGQLSILPATIEVAGLEIPTSQAFIPIAEFADLTETDLTGAGEITDWLEMSDIDAEIDAEIHAEIHAEITTGINTEFTDLDSATLAPDEGKVSSASVLELSSEEIAGEITGEASEKILEETILPLEAHFVQPEVPPSRPQPRQTTEFHISSDSSNTSFSPEENQDNTVRVPMKHLNQLNDLLGELTIERNRLDLHLKRMRSMIQTLSHRVKVLDQSNAQLRLGYDRVATQSPQESLPLLPAAVAVGNAIEENGTFANHRFDVLEMDRYGDLHSLSQEVMETIVQVQEVTSDMELGLDDTEQTNRDLHKTAKQLQMNLSQVRMRPLSDILDRFPKAIRELSLQHHKAVQLKVHGGNTLVDRNILEALSDPILHLIRNAFDHGIEDPASRRSRNKPEQGTIEIRAFHRNNRTVITISDDGGGIPLHKVRARAQQMGLDEMLLAAANDEELLSLIFEPGFSTSDRVTDLSGRGIGMDVVRNNLKQIRGDIRVNTEAGVGTTFTLSVPLTLSVARVLLVESGGMLMAFPTDVINEMFVLQPDQVVMTAGNQAIPWQNTMVQLLRLSQWLQFNCPRQMDGLETPPTINQAAVLILNQGNHQVGLQIDRCWGEQEVALRRVEGNLPLPAGFNSCTILGDGRVVPLVNVPELLHWIASSDRAAYAPVSMPGLPSLASTSVALPSRSVPVPALIPVRKPTILVVDDSINVRRLLALTLEKAGYQVAQAKDGQDALDKLCAGLQVQAVICDIEMPRLDGYGFLARVKSTPDLEQLPIAMLTSRSGDKHRQLAMNLGATAYFSKPYNEQTLLQTLEKLMVAEVN